MGSLVINPEVSIIFYRKYPHLILQAQVYAAKR